MDKFLGDSSEGEAMALQFAVGSIRARLTVGTRTKEGTVNASTDADVTLGTVTYTWQEAVKLERAGLL